MCTNNYLLSPVVSTIVTVSSTVRVRFISSHYRTCWTQQLDWYWKYDHIISDIWDQLHWLPIQQRLEYKVCLLIFKCLHQMAPVYLTEMNDPVSASTSQSHLRSAVRGDLVIPHSRTTTYGQRSFSASGPSLWNSLPLSVRDPSLTMKQFCTHLKTFLFRRAYCTYAPLRQFRL